MIAPPSRHISGGTYQWTGPWTLPDLPDHLFSRVRPPERPTLTWTEPVRLDRALSAWAAKALDDEARQVGTAPAGGRNHRLSRAAFSLGQIVGAGLLDPGTVTDHLHHAALRAGLGAREATMTIRSGLQAGMTRPRAPADRTAATQHHPPIEPAVELDIGSG